MWLSVAAFVIGGLTAGYGALQVADRAEQKEQVEQVGCWQLQELHGSVYKVNRCTGTFERIELAPAIPNK